MYVLKEYPKRIESSRWRWRWWEAEPDEGGAGTGPSEDLWAAADAVRELALQLSQGRAWRGEGTACAKALRRERA